VHFIPIPLHPFFAPYLQDGRNQTPEALDLYPRLVSLPLFPAMSEEDVIYVADAIKEIARQTSKTKSFAVAGGGGQIT